MRLEFFRHCPGCGRRFHIILVDKRLVDSERNESRGVIGMLRGNRVGYVQEGPPAIFNIEEFRYTYKCKHCGHEWTETRLQDEHEESADEAEIPDD